MAVYGTLNNVPGDQIEVRSGGTVGVTPQFESTAVLVGGMDTDNGSATTGEVVEVQTTSDALNEFGENSELYEAASVALQNGVGTLYGAPVAETEETESFSSTASFTVSNTPVFDPNVQYEHEVTVTDTDTSTDLDVNIVYEAPSQPTASDTVNFNPLTGAGEVDTSGNYDVTYTHGDYDSATTAAVDENPRIIGLLTENTSVVNDTVTEVNSTAEDFDFMHVVAGITPDFDASNYTDSIEERRVGLVGSPRGYIDDAQSTELRTAAGVAGKYAANALGDTATYESIAGYTGLRTDVSNSEASDLIDAQVAPLQMRGTATLLKDMTTATDVQFERIYASEITDEVTELSHIIAQEFIGELNTDTNRRIFKRSHEVSYKVLLNQTPPLLDGYDVSVSEGTDPDTVVVDIGANVVDVIDNADITITVGDIITNGGAE